MDYRTANDRCFNDLVTRLNGILRVSDEVDRSESNHVLDQLNALSYKTPLKFNNKETENLICQCFSVIAPSNTFLVAKCCHLILNMVGKQGLVFSEGALKLFIEWVTNALENSADVAYIDILQAIQVVIKGTSVEFDQTGDRLLSVLLCELETRSSLADPSSVKMYRLKCLHLLARALPDVSIFKCVREFINILNSQPATDPLIHAQVWRNTLETLCYLCKKNRSWVEEYVCDLLSVVLAGVHLGLHGNEPKLPQQFHPIPSIIAQPLREKTTLPRINVRGKKKGRMKEATKWREDDESKDKAEAGGPVGGAAGLERKLGQFNRAWPQSDSDFSDSEGGAQAKLNKEHARTRHSAISLLILLVQSCRCKRLFGYYNVLLGNGALLYSIKNETSVKPRIAALAAITALLSDAKHFLAQAQHSEGGSFVTFSEVLSEMMSSLHVTLGALLSSSPGPALAVPLLHCTSQLITVSPYHRLKPGLLTSLFSAVQPYISHKDSTVVVGALQCLKEITTGDPSTTEHDAIILTGASTFSDQNVTWLPNLCLQALQSPDMVEAVSVGWWQLVTELCRCHIDKLSWCLDSLERLIMRDLATTNRVVQLYAARAIEPLSARIVNNEEVKTFYLNFWTRLLEGPLVPILQSQLVVASVGCDCLANIGSLAFLNLKERVQISVVNLVYGCSYHEESSVRASAVRTLGVFLLCPNLHEEQYVCDIYCIVQEALKDPVIIVRVKAAWAFANLVELLLAPSDKDFGMILSVPKMLEISLTVTSDNFKVQANMLRAIGTLLLLIKQEHLDDLKSKDCIQDAAAFLVKSATSNFCMKMRWNACHALGSMLKNVELHEFSSKWQSGVLTGLCNLLVKCNNFKVRMNACAALGSLPQRCHYANMFHTVWLSVVDGFDNAANMPDFREFKHQDALIQQLCMTLCHLGCLVEVGDVEGLWEVVGYSRGDMVRSHIAMFQASAPPELSSPLLGALNHLAQLSSSSTHQFTSQQRQTLDTLRRIFTLDT